MDNKEIQNQEDTQTNNAKEYKSVFKMFYKNCFKSENLSVFLSFVSIALTLVAIFIQMFPFTVAGYVFYIIFYLTSFISAVTALFIEAAFSMHKKEFKLKFSYFLIIFAFALLLILI